MATMKLPEPPSAYIRSCVKEVGIDVYGRESRVPIHDAIRSVNELIIALSEWCNEIGLCVKDGKLCVIYNQ